MSRQVNQPMQNGIPPQWCGTQPPKSTNYAPSPLNNGVGSSQSSRDSSPMSRIGGIPASQLPPGMKGANGPPITPQSSPRMTTSTPINNSAVGDVTVNKQTVRNQMQMKQNLNQPVQPFEQNQQFPPQTHVQTSVSTSLNTSNNLQYPRSSVPPHLPPNTQLQQSNIPQVSSLPQPQQHQQKYAPSQQQPNLQQSILPPKPIVQQQKYPPSPLQQQQQVVNPPFSSANQTMQFAPPVQNSIPPQQPNLQYQQKYPPSPLQQQQQQQQVVPPFGSTNQNIQFPPPVQNSMPPTQNQFAPNSYPSQQQQQQIRPPPPPGQFNTPPSSNAPLTNVSSNLHAKRYPQTPNQNYPQYPNQQNANLPPTSTYNNQQYNQQQQQQQPTNAYYQQQQQQQNLQQEKNYQNLPQQMQQMNVVKSGFNKLWGNDNYDLLQCPNVLPEEQLLPPKVSLGQEFLDNANCSPEIFRCTMTKIPESNSLLQKSRLPLGVLIHPFKDLNHLPVISCNTIVRCRACRTYINPFIFFVDTKRWKCNLCYRVNELPEEFQYDPVSKTYGDPSRRPEIKSSTIEYIAPSEYMLRPPQPAVYLFLLDISRLAVESGYLHTVCEVLSAQLSTLPGDARTQIGFLAYNSTLRFFSLAEGLNQPHEMIVSDIDDVFLPCPDNLLVNLKEHMDLVTDLLTQLPTRYQTSYDAGSALGCALQAAFKLMGATGGRVTVFQAALPQLGPGALTVREDPNQRAGKEAPHLNPATDFYKRLALDCSGHQIAVDLFLLNSQYVDVATLSGISRFSGGCMHHFPLYKASNPQQSSSLERCFRRYLTRKIGFEAVMRIRCTRGLAIHTFHGNFFVRSTDLLSLPNVNPDAGFGMQVAIEESLTDLQTVCFQAALLYTSSKGERRIRVHTLCLPVVSTLSEVLNAADQQCIVGLLSKMAVDRSLQSSLSDARDAFINVAIDILSSYKLSLNLGNNSSGLAAPQSLKLLPLYILALLKCTAFRTGQSTRLDDRVFAMCDMKTLPLPQLLQAVYPDLYPIYRLGECPSEVETDGTVIPKPRRLQLTARNIDTHGAYLLDAGQQMIIYVCQNVSQQFLVHALGVPNYMCIPDQCFELQKIENPDNERLHAFINRLNDEKAYPASLQIVRENSPSRNLLIERLIEDRIEFALSYNEFLQHVKTQVK